MSLLSYRIRPPACAYGAEPFSVDEIDAHPDCARIWATILALRAEFSGRNTPSRYEPGLELRR